MIISLIGFMAAGKTTLGKELAQRVGAPFIDLDNYIEEKEGKTIPEIFETEGENKFREMEASSLEDILEEYISQSPETLEDNTRCSLVISLGGGAVMNPRCRDLISRFTFCVYIKRDIETLLSRLSTPQEKESRALLKDEDSNSLRETVERLYKEREPLYEALANTTI